MRWLVALGLVVACRSVREPANDPPDGSPTLSAAAADDAAPSANANATATADATATPSAAVDASADVTVDAAARVTTGAASTAEAGVGCSQHGNPCNPQCASIAASYLALAPDGRGTCDAKSCAAAGGACAYGGFCFGQACIKRTRDGGATCTDGSQCESKACFAPDSAKPGPGTGRCSGVVLNLGCHAPVEHGVVGRTLCGD